MLFGMGFLGGRSLGFGRTDQGIIAGMARSYVNWCSS
jgi:hypothetical protein